MDKEASSPTTIACHHLLRAIPFPDALVLICTEKYLKQLKTGLYGLT
jgi:hypothetical protein